MEYTRTLPNDIQQEILPTWASHVWIPLSQNILGGVAVGALGMIGAIAYTGAMDRLIDLYNASVWCTLAGGVGASLITVIRFWGDDLGLLITAYRLGHQSRDAEVSALHMEIHALRNDTSIEQAQGSAISALHKRQEQDARAKKNADKLIEIAFQGDKITRAAMDARGMGRHDWDAAVRLLRAAAVMDEQGIIVATKISEAYRAVDELIATDRHKGDSFVPSWQ